MRSEVLDLEKVAETSVVLSMDLEIFEDLKSYKWTRDINNPEIQVLQIYNMVLYFDGH